MTAGIVAGCSQPSVSPSVAPDENPPSVEPSVAGEFPASLVVTDDHFAGMESVTITVTVPAPGWESEQGTGLLIKNDNADPPDGAGLIVFPGVDAEYFVYGDPCQWSTTRPDNPATTVDELVAALMAQPSRKASTAIDVTLDGYFGAAITLHVPDNADFAECDGSRFASWGVTGEDPSRWNQGPGQIDEVWILDVDGRMVVLDWAYYATTPPAVVDELRAIVESATFD